MSVRFSPVVLSIPLAVGACSSAPKSNEVSAAYVPVAQYNNYTCEQLVNEAEAIRRSTPALEAAVDKHRSNQTGVEVVTWVLFWPAAFALDKGQEYSAPLAKAKGELQAIQTALMTKKCSETSLPLASTVAKPEAPPVSSIQSVVSREGSTLEQGAESGVAARLRDLERLRKDGILTEQEYQKKRLELLEKL